MLSSNGLGSVYIVRTQFFGLFWPSPPSCTYFVRFSATPLKYDARSQVPLYALMLKEAFSPVFFLDAGSKTQVKKTQGSMKTQGNFGAKLNGPEVLTQDLV